MDTILIIGGRVETIAKAKELGLRVVFVQHRDRMLPGHVELADALLMVDYTDWDILRPMVEAAHEVYKFTKVISLGEQAMEPVGRINDHFGLGGTPFQVSALFKDKLAMRRHLRQEGIAGVAAADVTGLADIEEFGREYGYPVVLKPIDNTASRGVVVIERAEDVPGSWEYASGLRDRDDLKLGQFFPVGRLLVEEYIPGPEYSVETFSFAGRHSVVSITEKYTNGVVEAAHALPARLSAESDAEVCDYVRGFLGAMGLRDGVAHTEIKISPQGPRVIESHDRIAGERIPELVLSAYEVDLELYAVGAPFGLLPELPDRPAALRGAATRFLTGEPGVVTGYTGTEAALEHPDLIELLLFNKPGDRVVAVHENFDRSGQVSVSGVDTEAAARTADALAARITVRTEPAA